MYRVAYATPEIGLPADIEGKAEQITVWIAVRKTGRCGLCLSRPVARIGRSDTDRRVIPGTRLLDLSSRGHEIGIRLGDVLVRDIQFVFKSIQFGLLIDLPPSPSKCSILRLRGLPCAAIRSLLRTGLLERWRGRNRWA